MPVPSVLMTPIFSFLMMRGSECLWDDAAGLTVQGARPFDRSRKSIDHGTALLSRTVLRVSSRSCLPTGSKTTALTGSGKPLDAAV